MVLDAVSCAERVCVRACACVFCVCLCVHARAYACIDACFCANTKSHTQRAHAHTCTIKHTDHIHTPPPPPPPPPQGELSRPLLPDERDPYERWVPAGYPSSYFPSAQAMARHARNTRDVEVDADAGRGLRHGGASPVAAAAGAAVPLKRSAVGECGCERLGGCRCA